MKRKLHLLLIVLLSQVVLLQGQNFSKGKIADTQYSDFDIPVYTIDAVIDFNADNSGQTDASSEIQAALDQADDLDGGIVFLPAGTYLLENPIEIPDQVTLRGDWKRPSAQDKTVAGTVLHIVHGVGTDEPAIALYDYSMLRDVSIYYPNQDLSGAPINYPYTVESFGDFSTVRNITLVNSFQGIRFEPQNGKSVKLPTVIGIYGCPIANGIYIDQTAATPRTEDIHFGPEYWSQSGLATIDYSSIQAAITAVEGVAILSGKGAGGAIFVGIEIDGYSTGLKTSNPSSPRVFDLNITNCKIGIDIGHTKDHGWVLTGGSIQATDKALYIHDLAKNVQINSFTFESDNQLIVQETGVLGLTKCTFSSWGVGNAIESDTNYLSVVACIFDNQQNKHIKLGKDVSRAVIYGNTVTGGELDIRNNSTYGDTYIIIDTTSVHDFIALDRTDYPFKRAHMQVPTPPAGESHIFTITDFGAVGDGVIDDTAAIQAALDAAGSLANASAGCEVFVPTGVFRLNSDINVPEYVELRGVNDNPTNGYGRSILALFANKGNPTGKPDIKLEANSGLKSLYLYRPEQTWNGLTGDTTIHEYPYAVEGTDKNWAYNVILSNLYDGIDFSKGGGHHLDFLFACSINNVLKIGNGDSELSVIENFQVKTEAWRNAKSIKFPAWQNTGWTGPSAAQAEAIDSIGTGIFLKGDGAFRLMGHFVNRTGYDLYKIKGSPTLNMYLCGGEGIGNGSLINSDDGKNFDIEIVGNSYHTMGDSYTTSTTNVGDTLHVVNCKNYGAAPINHHFKGAGHIVMQQEYRGRSHDVTLKLEGTTTGVIESGYLEKGAVTRIRTLDESIAKMCAAITLRPDWPFVSTDDEQICIESVSPAILQGISGTGLDCVGVASASDAQLLDEITLYPNPTDGTFTIDLGSQLSAEEIQVTIFNSKGVEIIPDITIQDNYLNVTINKRAGLYFVTIVSNSTVRVIKLVKN